MDIFSHGLWTAAVAKGTNDFILKPKNKKPLKLWLAVFWGIFPDVFAFTIPFIWMIGGLILGNFKPSDLPSNGNMEPSASVKLNGLSQLTHFLYSLSHSLIIFFAIFAAVYFIFRRPIWEMLGWLLHILIDIPSHSYQFFPTPFLWPVSNLKFNGLSWASPKFLIINYSLLVLVYLFFWIIKTRKKKIN